VFAIITVTLGRLLVRSIQHSLLKRDIGMYRVVVIGHDRTTKDLVQQFASNPRLGYRVIARYDAVSEDVLTHLEQLITRVGQGGERGFDILLQADSSLPREQTQTLIDFANYYHCTFRYTADLFETQATNINVETLAGIPVIEIQRTKLDGWGRILKRAFDCMIAGTLLILASPLFFITALFIRADSRGPVFVRLRRVGEGGKPFDVYKFRSMVENAHAMKPGLMQYNERSGPLFKMKNDPRITRVGRFLRRTSIDELPQFWNVLRGNMSIVGPRPHEPEEVARYERHHRQLLTIKPGVTGLAQVSGRSDLPFDDEARLDIFYIENWSLKLDLIILFRTPIAVLRMKSAA
jgi:exopolysaccharide biosynthesis polyprenyl glycosylphosphotransferase